MIKSLMLTVVGGILSACATLPDVEVSYYPAKAITTVTVTQTVDCDKSQTSVVVANAVSAVTVYSSDRKQTPHTFKIKLLDGSFADTNLTFGLTDDGRLKSVNATSTGQGENILKSATTLLATFSASLMEDMQAPSPARPKPKPTKECLVIAAWGGGKPVTLTYSRVVEYKSDYEGEVKPIKADLSSEALYDRLKGVLPILSFKTENPVLNEHAAKYTDPTEDVVHLWLNETANVNIRVQAKLKDILQKEILKDLWQGEITIPSGDAYCIPIPKSALFGTQTFSLSLSDAGAITSIGYSKGSGVAGVLNAVNSAASPFTPQSEAAQEKAKADLIAQQQRLVACEAKPDTCKP